MTVHTIKEIDLIIKEIEDIIREFVDCREDFDLRKTAVMAFCLARDMCLNRLHQCPYREDMTLFCAERCGREAAIDCPIYMRETGLLADSLRKPY